MGVIRKKNPETGKWEVYGSSEASDINLIDVGNNFETKNVEGALREMSDKLSESMADVNAQKSALVEHSNTLAQYNNVLREHASAIEWLKVNGGGGGGGGGSAAAPTITSTFEDGTIVTKEEDVEIPIFFASPNLGEGTAYVIIDNIEVASIAGIKQGNNVINIGKLTNLKNKVSIYVKDRTNMLSNQLNWTIIAGGIDLEITFDDTADYFITDQIYMQFDINSASDEPIIMHMTIDFDEYEVECNQGFNEYYFPEMGIGIHSIKLYITSGPYKTPEHKFNIVVVSSNSLYVSTTFQDGTEITVGNPVQIQYRISKASDETFTVNQYLNNRLVKTLNCIVGAYYWTLNDLDIGSYNAKIEIIGKYDEPKILELQFEVTSSGYTPIKIVEGGLLYRLSAKGRTNQDSDRDCPADDSGNGVVTTLHDFNWYTNGWVDGELVCDSNAYVEIDLKPWEDNAIYGSTIEIQYSSIDIGYTDSRIFDYTSTELTDEGEPFKGAYIDIEKTIFKSLANTGEISLDKGVDTTVSFVIDRRNKFGKIFVNGVCSRAFFLSDTGSGTSAKREDFSHNQKIYLNSRKGEDCFGACKIKDVRVYGRVLTDDEIVSNYIAQIQNLKEQERMYNFNFDNTTLPVIRMYGDTTNMTLETPVTMRIKYTSPNEDYYGQSFDLPYCQVNWQGTSSLQYVLKNFTARLKDENMAPFYYTPYPNGIPEDTFCFKADYMESTHCRNVGIAKFVNECLYDSKNPMQLKDSKIRNTVTGFPCLMYINDELQGVYNFNLDRYSTKPFGYTDPEKCLVYEVSANSDTTAGAFYKWTEGSGKDKLSYYKSDFECVYPPTRAAGNDNMSELIRLVDWVNDSSDEDFKDNFDRYFNKEYVLRYYLFVLVFGAVDSLGKNMKLASWDGLTWYPQVYDADTTIGLDNTGFLKFDMDIEMGDHQVFNTTGSVLWKRVVELFQVELKEQYSLMRQDRFTVDNIMKYLYGEQISKIPAYYYNKDMQTKYLDFGSAYLYALHGNGEQHIRKWIRERIMYCDTLLGYNVSSSDYITLRSSKLGLVYLDIQTYIPMYVSVKWRDEANNTGLQTKRVGRGETVRFEYNMPTETDQEIIVYAGHYLKSLGNVSNLQPTAMLIANADRLTEIECHSPNLINTDLSLCKLLQKIDLSDCTALGTGIGAQPTLNITSCRYLRVCNCLNTKLTAIYTMQSGGNLEEIYYPESIQQVVLTNQTYLKRVGLPWVANETYCKNLANVQIENCKAIETIHYPFAEGDGLEFDTLRYTQNLTIKNSLDGLTNMTFQGFSKLKSISLAAMYNLSGLGFDDMMNTAESSTLESVKLSECPLISSITFNITSDFNKVEFAPGTIIDLSGMHSVHTIESNTTIKGLETLIVPTSLTTLNFNGEYGDGESDIINIWSSEVNHNNDNYSGIDLKDIVLKYLDMEGLKKVVNGKNFNIKINNVPNMNTNRDGKRLPYFKPEGAIDISDYTKSMRKLLKGVDLNKLTVINLPGHLQYDLSYLFEDAILPNAQQVMDIVDCYPMSDVWSYMLCGADLGFDNTEIVIPTDRPMDISGLFKDTNASTDFLIPDNIVDVSEMFKNCSNMKEYVYNWDREFPPENEMQTTDCYFGTGGDLELVEPAWGGLGFYENVVSQITVAIPNNEYTFALIGKANMTSVGYVTWGDGTMTKLTDPGVNYSHTYARAGVYTIRGHFTFGNNQPPHINLRTLVRTVDYIATGTTDLRQAFRNCSGLTSVNLKNLTPVNMAECFVNCYDLVNVDFSTLKTSDVVSMKSMFENCNSLKNINIQFDTSNVTDMSKMFYYCEELETLNVDTFNTNKVTDMNGMFAYCTKLKELNVSHFNTDLVTNMNSLFSDCESLTLLDLTSWNTDKVTDMAYMFRNCTQLPNIDVSSFNTENVTNMAYMFYNNAISDSLSVNHFNVSKVKNISYMFSRCYELLTLDISSWDTKNVTTMQDLFNYNWKLKSINLGQLNTESVTTMSNMFQACYVLEDLDISSFNTSNVKNMSSMFSNCKLLTTLDLKHFNTDKVTDMSYLFNYCSSLTNLDISNWNTSAVTEFTSMFSQCSAMETIDLSSIDTRNATEMSYMFQGCSKLKNIIFSNNFSTAKVKDLKQLFSNCISLQSIDTTKIQTDVAINLSNMFEGCQSLTELNLAHFKTNNVEDMKEMFSKCSNLINLDISGWNTTNVNNMEQMFSGCSKITSLDISHFNTEKVINMGGLFSDCLLLSELNLGKLSTVNVVSVQDNDWDNMYGINNMFNNCKSLKSIDVSSFATSKITEFLNVFNNCSSLETIDLSKWDLSSATTLSGMFGGCSKLAEVNLANHNTSKVKNVDNMFNGFGGTTINMENCSFDSVTSTKSFVNAANLTDVIAPLSVKVSIEYTAPNLTNQSLQSIINGLVNTGSAKTLKIGEVNVKKLTTDQLTELQAKNWSVS